MSVIVDKNPKKKTNKKYETSGFGVEENWALSKSIQVSH